MARQDLVRVELRFDSEVYAGVKALADGADISVNQLMQGISRWAVKVGHVGEAEVDESGVDTKDQPGCLWFGYKGGEDEWWDKAGNPHCRNAEVLFELDFTERHVVREGEPHQHKKGK